MSVENFFTFSTVNFSCIAAKVNLHSAGWLSFFFPTGIKILHRKMKLFILGKYLKFPKKLGKIC
jgi:hypothetical protein